MLLPIEKPRHEAKCTISALRHVYESPQLIQSNNYFNRSGLKKRSGQAVIEYVLLVALCTLIFGAMFTAIRQNLYQLWICQLAPRVQAATGCDTKAGSNTCWQHMGISPPNNCS